MNNMFLLYGLLAWVVLLIVAIINGAVRNTFYTNKIGDLRAHQLSSFIYALLILLVTYFFLVLVPVEYNLYDLEILGLIWVIMTIIVEFILGHFIMKKPWKKLLDDYNLLKGRIWIMVLLIMLSAPYMVNYYL
jgi:uncharacterized protein YneF (UPF0154 family)